MEKNWEHIAVLGAAGKMGKGIALLLLQEMAGRKEGVLTLLDTNSSGFKELSDYLKDRLLKYAERNINRLRLLYQDRNDLIDNRDMICAFVNDGLNRIRFVTAVEECRGARMIFEAIWENLQAKAEIFSKVDAVADPEACYFSNTSSIPVHLLQKRAHLQGRLIGFHFYNPPTVQKLVEMIVPDEVKKEVLETALDFVGRLNKLCVFSKDIAGFIGNGHFIREVVEACGKVESLKESMSLPEAICLINTVTQDYLIRPMGIFQLVDYVGIDVVRNIAQVMTDYLPGQVFNKELIDAMVLGGVSGGQRGDGSQKNGFFSYANGTPIKVYDLKNWSYAPYVNKEEVALFPKGHESWKTLSKDKDRKEKMAKYFVHLYEDHSIPSRLAVEFLEHSKVIACGLVNDGVARSIEDVDMVLQNGFFHLYGVEEPSLSRYPPMNRGAKE